MSVDVAVKAGAFLLLPVYLNLMSADEFGRYSYIMSIVGMFAFVFGMGQHAFLSRFYHSEKYTRQEVVETVHLVLITSFSVLGLFLVVFQEEIQNLMFKSPISETIYFVMILLAALTTLNQIFMMFLYQSEQVSLVQKKNVIDFLTINIISLCMLYWINHPGDDVRVIAMTMAYMLIISVFYYRFFNMRNFLFTSRSFALYKRSIINGAPMAVGSCASFFIAFGDRFVIEKLLNNESLGVFSFSMVIVGTFSLVFHSFQNVWFPYLFKEKNLDVTIKRIYKFIGLFLILGIFLGVGFYFIVYILTEYFISKIYLMSLDFLWILVIAVYFQISGMLMAGLYQIFEKNHVAVPVNLIAGAVNILLNYYLISEMGLVGAALSTAIISFVLFIFHFFMVHYYKNKGLGDEYYSSN
jgi:O-antigen/teichoic acid export membrane protein